MKAKKSRLVFDVVTLFPEMVMGPLQESLLGRAQRNGLIEIRVHNLRNWSDDPRHAKVDDRPYGGGAGMVIRPEPLYRALKSLGGLKKSPTKPWVVYLSPQGTRLVQKESERLAKKKHLILICGHYEGVDERIMTWVDQEISIGDYVLTGGELPALVLIDSVARLVPGVVGDPESLVEESFSNGHLDFPHYTRPQVWRKQAVPNALVSGDHNKISEWRRSESLKQTEKKRPDLMKSTGKIFKS